MTVLYVGFDVSEDKDSVTYVLPGQMLNPMSEGEELWGGIDRDSLLLFWDVVGSTGNTTEPDKPLVPEIFIPETKADYQNALFDEPTQAGEWIPFFDSLNQISSTLSKSNSGARKTLIVALNLFHPDGPGGMPPQFNSFVRLVKETWDSKAKQMPDIDLCLFISHDFGQRNYQHSDPEKVGSHFKRTLELFFQGKAAKLSKLSEITLDSLRDAETGLIRAVAESAARHEFIQTPVVLSKESTKTNVRLCSPTESPTVGEYFVYRNRSESPRNVDKWWGQLNSKVEHRHWEVENPLDLQRANMLLLQYERLWFAGREPDPNSEIEAKLNGILVPPQTVRHPQHSLHDIRLSAAFESDEQFSQIADTPFDLRILSAADPDGKPVQLEGWESKVGGRFKRKAYEVWNAIVNAELLDKNSLRAATELLGGSNFDFSPPVNELVFLNRIKEELPTYTFGDTYMRAIREALKTRDASNRLGAELNPVLLEEYSERYKGLENERRILEDKLFGFDGEQASQLAFSFEQLKTKYQILYNIHDSELKTIKEFNRSLIEAPHSFRYAVEVLSNKAETSFSTNHVAEYSDLWNEFSSSDATEVDIADISEKTAKIKQLSEKLYVAELNVNATTDIVIDNPEDVATNVRNTSQRLLLFWPSKFRYGSDNFSGSAMNSSRQFVRQVLNVSAIEDAGEVASKQVSKNYEELVSLAMNGFVNSDGRLLFPMVRRLNEKRTSRLANLSGWPLLATAAKETQLAWPVSKLNSEQNLATKTMIESINAFHFQKSDFQFHRLQSDFWGTRVNGKRYVEFALSEHDRIVGKELLQLDIDMEAKRKWLRSKPDVRGSDNAADVENSWGSATQGLISSAEAAFGNNEFWDNKDSTSTTDELMLRPDVPPTGKFREFVQEQFFNGNKFLISIRSSIQGDKKSKLTAQQRSDQSQVSWFYKKFTDNQQRPRDLYLRGWQIEKQLPDYRIQGESSAFAITLRPKRTETPRLKIIYGAEDKNKTIVFLIDCSRSMLSKLSNGKQVWDDVTQQLPRVFKRLIARGDINIELFAFGRTRKVVTIKDPDTKRSVIKFNDNGAVVYSYDKGWDKWTKSNLAEIPGLNNPGDNGNDWDVIYSTGANTLDELNAAILQLRPFGETPLFAAVYQALKLERTTRNNYFVAITDGIDFVSGRKTRGKSPGPNEAEYRWEVLRDMIRGLGQKRNMVEYNYLLDPSKPKAIVNGKERWPDGNNGTIRKQKYDAFKDLVSASRLQDEELSAFLKRLFPFPVVSVSSSSQVLVPDAPFDINNKYKQVLVGKYEQTVGGWWVDVGAEGKFNLNRPARWKSKIPLAGNEYLEYLYSPDDGTLDLIQPRARFGPKTEIQGVQCEFKEENGSADYLVDFGIFVQSAFDFWSADDSLTPSPINSFMSATSPTGRQFLIQDYNETASQSTSNLRQIVFSELSRNLLEKLGFDENTALMLNLQQSPNPTDWHLLEFFEPGQRFKLRDRSNDRPLELPKGDNRLLENISGNDGEYRIEIRYDDDKGYREYTFSVSRSDPKSNVPLDCWLIQVVGENGRRNNRVFHDAVKDPVPVKRIYKFDPDGKLERMEHKFAFEGSSGAKDFNDGRKGFFGLMRVDASQPLTGFVQINSRQFHDE